MSFRFDSNNDGKEFGFTSRLLLFPPFPALAPALLPDFTGPHLTGLGARPYPVRCGLSTLLLRSKNSRRQIAQFTGRIRFRQNGFEAKGRRIGHGCGV